MFFRHRPKTPKPPDLGTHNANRFPGLRTLNYRTHPPSVLPLTQLLLPQFDHSGKSFTCFCVQVVYDANTLYVFAPSHGSRSLWVQSLKQGQLVRSCCRRSHFSHHTCETGFTPGPLPLQPPLFPPRSARPVVLLSTSLTFKPEEGFYKTNQEELIANQL